MAADLRSNLYNVYLRITQEKIKYSLSDLRKKVTFFYWLDAIVHKTDLLYAHVQIKQQALHRITPIFPYFGTDIIKSSSWFLIVDCHNAIYLFIWLRVKLFESSFASIEKRITLTQRIYFLQNDTSSGV